MTAGQENYSNYYIWSKYQNSLKSWLQAKLEAGYNNSLLIKLQCEMLLEVDSWACVVCETYT